jgi:hypothetical protein
MKVFHWPWPVALLGAVGACGGDGGTGPSAASLAGTWRATQAQLVSVANPSTQVDLVAMGGTVRLVLSDAQTFTLTVLMPAEPDDITTGSWSSSIDVLTLTYGSGSMQFDMTLSGNTLTLTGANGDYDFNGDDTDEPAKISLTLTRE